jgi:hypothetical protein
MERLERAWANPERRARLLKWMYIISTGFMLLGFAVMFYLLFVRP